MEENLLTYLIMNVFEHGANVQYNGVCCDEKSCAIDVDYTRIIFTKSEISCIRHIFACRWRYMTEYDRHVVWNKLKAMKLAL